ncbi:MAG: SCP2 sterol-binding domain-containing protein [Thermodesulfobacteriota bacterium]
MIFLSREWVEALAEMLRNDEDYQKKGKGFDSYYQIVATPSPEKGVTEDKACGLLLPMATETWMGVRDQVDYTMTAPYEVYYRIFKGDLNPVVAMTTGKAKLKGSMAKALRYSGATNKFVAVMKKLPTKFEGAFV